MRRFRPTLLFTFSVISFVLLVALGIALAIGIQNKLEESALHQQAQSTIDQVNANLVPQLRPEDLQDPWVVGSARYNQLDRLIRGSMLRDHVVRVKVWRPDGTILYSDASDLIGKNFPPEEDLAEALSGQAHMDVSDLTAAENEFEAGQFKRLLEVYVPLGAAGATENTAIFETYHDLASVDAINEEMRSFLWTALAVGLAILYASLFTLVYRASRTLTRQNHENARLFDEVSQRLAERLQVEQTLRDRIEGERLLLAISTNFINLDSAEVDNGVRQALRALGSHMNVDRCYVMQFERSEALLTVTHEWGAIGVVPLSGILNKMSTKAIPWLHSRLSAGETVNIQRVANLPGDADAEREFLSAVASKSVLLVPMIYNKNLVGALGLDHVRDYADWSEDSFLLLKIAGETLVNALERKRADAAIRESEQRFRAVFENASLGIALMTANRTVLDSNKAMQDLLGYSEDELRGLSLVDVTHPEDHPKNLDYLPELLEGKRKSYRMDKRYVRKNGDVVWAELLVSAVRDSQGIAQYCIALVQNVTERKQHQEEIRRQLARLNSLRTIDNSIIFSFDLQNTLHVVLEQVIGQVSVDAASVSLLNSQTGSLEYTAGTGFRSVGVVSALARSGEMVNGRGGIERLRVQRNDLSEGSGFLHAPLLEGEEFLAYHAVPLVAKGKLVGVLEVFNRQPLAPDAEWVHFLETLAGQTAIAVDNAFLFLDLQRHNLQLSLAYETTLEGWSRALDLRDRETEGHTRRVTEMAVRLATAMGISEEEIVHIRRGGLLHDIGKMGIPDAILLKNGPLTGEEWEIMQRHPAYAYELLSPIKFLEPALDIPYYHHEKWDGTGYPRGLQGSAIPLAARVFAIADVYDALRSDRPYRAAWPEDKVVQHIKSLSGTHFDPVVVAAFLRMDRTFYRSASTIPLFEEVARSG
ncbi:MAG: HD domain-containing phosphohydrolase [Chloroflexota bacterium]